MTLQRRMRSRVFARAVLAVAVVAGAVDAQGSDSIAPRPLATRAELETVAERLASRPGEEASEARSMVLRRLAEGDFGPGASLLLEVQGEPTLSDTFIVAADGSLLLPSPAVGALPMHGVLRSEAAGHVTVFVARFVNAPVVRVRPLVRVALEGEVARAGFYAVPADALLSDALMVADGITADADLRKVRHSRGGRMLRDGKAMREAIARGWTLDDAHLQDGDALVVGRGRGDLEGRLRFLWVIVSLTGGIYGLSRAL